MKEKELKDLTVWSVIREVIFLSALIGGHYLQITALMNGVIWLLWFVAALAMAAVLLNASVLYRYTKRKYQFEIWTQMLLGAVLAGYGYYVLATVLTFSAMSVTQRCYFGGKNE